jgi:biopolymer transport protein TolR
MHATSRAADDEPMADMNLIPLIDIALTLLIILMVTTAFIRRPGVALRLPETATREGAPESTKDLVVTVTADGSLYLDGQKRDAAAVARRLRATATRDRQARVLVKGDREVPYKRMMDVMDLVRQAGLTRIVLPTEPEPPGSAGSAAATAVR